MRKESSKNSTTNDQGSFEAVETPTRQVARISPHVANLQQETTDTPHIFYIIIIIILRDDIEVTRTALFRFIDAISIISCVEIQQDNGRVSYSISSLDIRNTSLLFANPAVRRQVNPQTNLSDSPCPSISPN